MLELERKEEGVVAVVVEDSMESEQRTIILFSISPLDWEERERMGFFRNSGSGFLRY